MNDHERRLAEIRQLNLQLRELSKKEPSEEKSSTMHVVREEMAGVLRSASDVDRKELEEIKEEFMDDLVVRMKKMEGEPEIGPLMVTEDPPEYQPDPRCLSLMEEESAGLDRQFCKLAEGHAESCSSKAAAKIKSMESSDYRIAVDFEDGSCVSMEKALPFGDKEHHWCVRFRDVRSEFKSFQFARMKDRDVAAGFAGRFVYALLNGKPLGFWVDGWDYLKGDDVKGYDSKKLLKKLEGDMDSLLLSIRAKEEELQKMHKRRGLLEVEISELKVKDDN